MSDRVRRALMQPDLCHREPEFFELQTAIRDGLLAVYGLDADRWAAVLLTGSGTAAVEAMISSLIPKHGRLLSIENGVYGERMTNIALRHGISVHTVPHQWQEPIDLGRVRQRLRENACTHVSVVHHETTTGRLNDMAALATLCQEFGARLLLDAVSSFAAEDIDFANWPVAACAATANKCLHGVPGTCLVVASRNALLQAGNPQRTVYLDLRTYCEQQDRRATPFTQSVQTFYALREALQELHDQGGQPARRDSYSRRIGRVREGLTDLGIAALLPASECSVVLQAFHLPEGVDYRRLHDGLKERGFIIYAGQGALAQSLFRISTMGDIAMDDVERLLDAVAQTIR